MKKYLCTVCGYVYDPEAGDPDAGVAPGTPFEEIPDDWACPVCGVGKDMFEAQYLQVKSTKASAIIRGDSCLSGVLPFFMPSNISG